MTCPNQKAKAADEQARDAKSDKPAITCSGEDEDAKAKDAEEDTYATKEQAARWYAVVIPR